MPAQTSSVDFTYAGAVTFSLNPFVINPTTAGCALTYSCSTTFMSGSFDLCNYSDSLTTATFDPSTGDFSFDTTDAALFGTGVIPFVITGSVGNPASE